MKRLIVAISLLGFAASAYGAVGDFADFKAARDFSPMQADAGGWMNSGGRSFHRAYKYRWQEGMVMDWYKPDRGLGEVDQIQAMKDWMVANPLAAGQKYQFELMLYKAWGWDTGWPAGKPLTPVRLEIRTVNLDAEWAEGDGVAYAAFNWSKDQPAATHFYAQTVYTDGDGIPGTPDDVLDTANCVAWTGYDGNPVGSFQNNEATLLRHINGVYDQDLSGAIEPGEDTPIYMDIPDVNAGDYHSVVLQYDPDHPAGWYQMPVMNDLLNNPLADTHKTDQNRGLTVGYMYRWDEDAQDWLRLDENNGCFYSLQQNNPTQDPKIRITIVGGLPIPGDATGEGCVDGADYTAWADHYGQTGLPAYSDGGWSVGNWTEDDTVDGADYTAWADNYGTGCAAQVPEPATLSLLALAACLPLLRRSQIRRGGRR